MKAHFRFVFVLAVAVLVMGPLGGCSTIENATSSVFGSGSKKKTTLPGKRISVLALQQKLEADPNLAHAAIKLPPPYENEDWPQPGGYANHAMYHLAARENLSRLWRSDIGAAANRLARIMAPPVIADGRVYTLDAAVRVTAHDLETGEEIWHADLAKKKEKKRAGFGGGIAFDNGRVFVATGFGRIHALDAATGREYWVRDFEIPFHAAPTANGGRVFAVTHDNHLQVLAQDDGRVLWSYQAISEQAGLLANASPAVAGEIVVVPYSSGELYAFRVQNGQPVWSDSLTRTGALTSMATINDIAGRPVIDRGRVIAISHSGRLVSIDLRSGERVWTRDISGIQTPWVAGDYIYVVTTEAELVCVSAQDGRVRWITPLQRWRKAKSQKDALVWSGPVLVGDRLIVVSSAGKAVSVSPYTGEILSQLKLGDGTFVPPVVAKGTVLVLTDGAELIAWR